jgi:hypothetical protein
VVVAVGDDASVVVAVVGVDEPDLCRGRRHCTGEARMIVGMDQRADRELDPLRPDRGATHRRQPAAYCFIRAGQRLCVHPLGVQRLRNRPVAHRHSAGHLAGRTLLDRSSCAARRREPVAPVRLAEGREGASRDRWHRSARHQSGGRRARSLATYSQPPVRRRTAKTIQPQQASSLAASAKVDAMRIRIAILAVTAAAAALLASTLGPKPAPRFVWNASESVPTGVYRVQPPRRLIVTDLVVAFHPNRWRCSSPRAGISRAACR